METYDIRGTINYQIFRDVLCECRGMAYRLDMESLSGGNDFTISSGVIKRIDEFNDYLIIRQEGSDSIEQFGFERWKHVGQRSGKGYEMFKITYVDGSYFKLFIQTDEGVKL